MAEQSHRDEMNAAIRAQRERHAAPRTIAPVDEPAPPPPVELQEPEPQEAPQPEAAAPSRKSLLDRLRGR
jgi:hypothetical protein